MGGGDPHTQAEEVGPEKGNSQSRAPGKSRLASGRAVGHEEGRKGTPRIVPVADTNRALARGQAVLTPGRAPAEVGQTVLTSTSPLRAGTMSASGTAISPRA